MDDNTTLILVDWWNHEYETLNCSIKKNTSA